MSSKLPLNKILLALLLIWLNVSQFQISLLSNISRHTIGYFQSISRVVLMEKLQIETIKLGGPGKHVQIDEAIVRKRKYHRGRQKKQIWIFGISIRGLGAFFEGLSHWLGFFETEKKPRKTITHNISVFC